MIATQAKLLDLIKKSPQFVIPIYQRTYSWTRAECGQLWQDILRAGRNEKVGAHFVGSIVYIAEGIYHATTLSPLLVIDGQQRLTTVTLLIAALADRLGEQEPLEGFSRRKLQHYYLLNDLEAGEKRFKLLLSQTDKASLLAIVDGREQPKEYSLRVTDNFAYFQSLLATEGAEKDLAALCRGLAKLMVVDVALSRDQDNPQLIFESMNSTGRELSQADLIRNFILMGLEPDVQTRLYERFWRPMEQEFGQEAYDTHFDGFMRHYLTVKTGEIPRESEVYVAFKDHSRAPEVAAAGIEALVREIREFAVCYCAMALGAETDPELKDAFHDLRELRVDVAYPFLLQLYRGYEAGELPKADFISAVRLVEAYVFRRAICGVPTQSLNRTFAAFLKAVRKDRYLESIEEYFLELPSYRRFPRDDEFRRDIQVRDLYKFPRRSYWLRRMENYGRKERVPVEDLTIEHILPQNQNLPAPWRDALGPEWKELQAQLVHTLGNLTLTAYNSEFSDRSFQEKRDMPGGFKESPLRLNAGLGALEEWTAGTIRERAGRLSEKAAQIWTAPKRANEVMPAYRSKSANVAYTIDDHAYLRPGPMRELFEQFRREVLALDECVTEEFLKLYVAYKAETNFVDVVPQASRLRLSLNMAFADVMDPRGICKDVTKKGRWGNGDVEVGLSSVADLPYVMGLVRQSFDQQMGDPATP